VKCSAYDCFFGTNHEKKVVWELTEQCQQNCNNCCNTHRRGGPEFSIEQAQFVVDELLQLGIKHVVLTGGEPLLCKELFGIIELIRSVNISVSICTNGMLLGKFAKKIKACGVSKVIVSLDTLVPDLYDYLRGTHNALSVVLKSIDTAISDKIRISIHTVVSESNIFEIPCLLKYAQAKSLNISMSSLVVPNGNHNIRVLKSILFNSIFDFFENDAEKDEMLLSIFTGCRAGIDIFGVKSNCTFTPCLWISNFSNRYDSFSIKENMDFDRKTCYAMSLCNQHSKTIQECWTIEFNFSCD